MPPISEQLVAVGDKVTHVNGEPVKDFTDLQLKTATAEGEMTYTVERKDGRIERVIVRR